MEKTIRFYLFGELFAELNRDLIRTDAAYEMVDGIWDYMVELATEKYKKEVIEVKRKEIWGAYIYLYNKYEAKKNKLLEDYDLTKLDCIYSEAYELIEQEYSGEEYIIFKECMKKENELIELSDNFGYADVETTMEYIWIIDEDGIKRNWH